SVGMAGNILDNVENVRRWYSRAIIGDFFVRASMPDMATGAAADIPEGIGDQLDQIDGIATIDPMRFVAAQSGDLSVLLIVREFLGDPSEFFDLTSGDSDQALRGLREGQAVVGSVLAQRMNVGVGDRIPLE